MESPLSFGEVCVLSPSSLCLFFRPARGAQVSLGPVRGCAGFLVIPGPLGEHRTFLRFLVIHAPITNAASRILFFGLFLLHSSFQIW